MEQNNNVAEIMINEYAEKMGLLSSFDMAEPLTKKICEDIEKNNDNYSKNNIEKFESIYMSHRLNMERVTHKILRTLAMNKLRSHSCF